MSALFHSYLCGRNATEWLIKMKSSHLTPFLKWPGGKRWLMEKYRNCFPKDFHQLYEPFLGGGATFFYLTPDSAVLSDVNGDLINLYQVMRDSYAELAQYMRQHQALHCKDYYYHIRESKFDDPVQAASRFLYLNRTCYNGMYRVNKSGQFNVPIGTKTNCIYDIDLFEDYSILLKKASIIAGDFAATISLAKESDLVFADPPYAISENQGSFIKYNESLFTWKDQERLCNTLVAAKNRGAYIVATNVNYDLLQQMYKDNGFFLQVVEHYSVVSGNAKLRHKQKELLISSRPFIEK